MESSLQNIRTFDSNNKSFAAAFYIYDIKVAMVLQRPSFYLIEPYPEEIDMYNAFKEYLASLSPSITIEDHIQNLFTNRSNMVFNEKFEKDSKEGVLVGIPNNYYTCFRFGQPLEEIPKTHLKSIVNRISGQLKEGEQILNLRELAVSG